MALQNMDNDWFTLYIPDFKSSVYGSSCNSVFFGLILSAFLSLAISWHSILGMLILVNKKRKQRSQNEAEKVNTVLHELPHTEIVKFATFRLTSDIFLSS